MELPVLKLSFDIFRNFFLWLKNKLGVINEEEKKHDKSIFIAINEILNEKQLKTCLWDMYHSAAYWSRELTFIDKYLHECVGFVEYNFIDPKIEAAKIGFNESLQSFHYFIAIHFFDREAVSMCEERGLRLYLYPDSNIDYEGSSDEDFEHFQKFLKDFQKHTDSCLDDYSKFRELVKERLLV